MTKTCGDYGGTKSNGEPCTRKAGWGRENVDEGKCKSHADVKSEKMKEVKKEFLDYLENNVTTIKNAAREVGKSEATIWRWRQDDEGFDRDVERAKKRQDTLRGEKLKDSLFKRAMQGEAAASEVIFALKNTTDWCNKPETVINNQLSQKQSQGLKVDLRETVVKSSELDEDEGDGLKVKKDDDK